MTRPFQPLKLLRLYTGLVFLYLPALFIFQYVSRLTRRYKRSRLGKGLILAPPKQLQEILEGASYLQQLDPEMFRRLTAERGFYFFYSGEGHKYTQMRGIIIFMPDQYLRWGKEGIATFFVKTILDFNLKFLPMEKALDRSRESSANANREIRIRIVEWLQKHSFPPELIKQYQ